MASTLPFYNPNTDRVTLPPPGQNYSPPSMSNLSLNGDRHAFPGPHDPAYGGQARMPSSSNYNRHQRTNSQSSSSTSSSGYTDYGFDARHPPNHGTNTSRSPSPDAYPPPPKHISPEDGAAQNSSTAFRLVPCPPHVFPIQASDALLVFPDPSGASKPVLLVGPAVEKHLRRPDASMIRAHSYRVVWNPNRA